MTIPQFNGLSDRPNILLFGVGHSGTTVLAKMLGKLGWNLGHADGFGENIDVRRLNSQILRGHHVAAKEALLLLDKIPSPWIIKDPRFVLTIAKWTSVFRTISPDDCPAMLFVTRATEKVQKTYVANGELKDGVPFMYGHTVEQLVKLSRQGYRRWPFQKLHVEFEQLIEAVKLFNVKRASRRDSPSEGNANAPDVMAY